MRDNQWRSRWGLWVFHGSALSPFSYGFYTSQANQFLPARCSILQYADDLAIYAAHYDVGNIQRTIQSACESRNGFFLGMRLSISEMFSRKHTSPPICVSLNGRFMPVVPNFRYLGVVFDGKLLWGAYVRYIQQKCFKRINFLRSMAGVSWGAHLDVIQGFDTFSFGVWVHCI
jgi:hypothetical protein